MIFDTFCLLTTLLAVVDGINIPFHIERHGDHRLVYRIPIQIGLTDSMNTISSYANVFDTDRSLLEGPMHDRDDSRNIRSDRLILANGNEHFVSRTGDGVMRIEPRLSMQYGDFFMFGARSIMIIPENHTSGQIVVNPTSPRSYVYQQQIHYTRQLPSDYFWKIEGRYSVLGELTRTLSVVLRPLEDYTYIPRVAYNRIESEIRARGTFQSVYGVTLNDGVDINELPTVFFHVDSEFTLAILPIDYLVPLGDQPNQYRFNIGHAPGSSLNLGKNLLRKVVLHLDRERGLVGFGDPLIEI